MKTETIAAIASAMTNSGIGIIRISGEDAFDVIDKIYRPKKETSFYHSARVIRFIMAIFMMKMK